jgi:hypothetical protein
VAVASAIALLVGVTATISTAGQPGAGVTLPAAMPTEDFALPPVVTPRVATTVEPTAVEPWMLEHPATAPHELEGYATATSVNPGDAVGLAVNTKAATFSGSVYRMGWAGGSGGLLMQLFGPIHGVRQTVPTAPGNGDSAVASWPVSVTVQTATMWPSGMYMVKLTDSTGAESYVPFVVRDTTGAAILFVHASITEQAYDAWGGVSLYNGRTAQYSLNHGIQVSFDRPYTDEFGAGQFFFWEYQMARFLEREGYDVGYTDDIAVAENPQELLRHKVIIIAGHDEYWSLSMRNGYENAVAHGVSLLDFGGNVAYRHVRLLPGGTDLDRTVVCYKTAADPEARTAPADATVQWRDPPTNRPESSLLGAEWLATGNTSWLDWIVANASSWVFAGSGAVNGEHLAGLLGYEEDGVVGGAPHPASMQVLSASPVATIQGGRLTADATVSLMPSGAMVLNIGSIQWSWGLDGFISPEVIKGTRAAYVSEVRGSYVNAVAQALTKNVINSALGATVVHEAAGIPMGAIKAIMLAT